MHGLKEIIALKITEKDQSERKDKQFEDRYFETLLNLKNDIYNFKDKLEE